MSSVFLFHFGGGGSFMVCGSGLTPRMSYRRRESKDARLANNSRKSRGWRRLAPSGWFGDVCLISFTLSHQRCIHSSAQAIGLGTRPTETILRPERATRARVLPFQGRRSSGAEVTRALPFADESWRLWRVIPRRSMAVTDHAIAAERQNSAMRAAHGARIGKGRAPPAFAAVILFDSCHSIASSVRITCSLVTS
jgi:hypothetical protein